MVCLGKICRSPLTEGSLQFKVNLEKVFVDSAGTGAYHIGKLPDERSINIAAKYGLNIKNQRALKFSKKILIILISFMQWIKVIIKIFSLWLELKKMNKK